MYYMIIIISQIVALCSFSTILQPIFGISPNIKAMATSGTAIDFPLESLYFFMVMPFLEEISSSVLYNKGPYFTLKAAFLQ